MTNEEFVAKRLEWLESRRAELIEAAQTEETADGIEARNAELEGIQAEIDEIKSLQKRESDLNEGIEERDFNPLGTYGMMKGKGEMSEDRKFSVESAEYREAWIKHLMEKELEAEERTALSGASYVIPTETMEKIIGVMEENPLYKEINPTHFPTYVKYPKESSVADASWVAMDTASTDSADALTEISLTAWKLIKTVRIDADITSMSIAAFETWLVQKIAKKLVKAICAAAIRGSGSSQPQGVLTAINASKTSITYDNILALMAAVEDGYQDDAIFVCSRDLFFNSIMSLKDSVGRPLVVQGIAGIGQKPEYYLIGHKVILDGSCNNTSGGTTTKSLIYGSFREGYKANWAKDPDVGFSDHAAYSAAARLYRGYGLFDGKVGDASAFAVATVTAA